MNLNDHATPSFETMQSFEGNLISPRSLIEENYSRSRIEPCEFERLLQRAMEILSARARSAETSSS